MSFARLILLAVMLCMPLGVHAGALRVKDLAVLVDAEAKESIATASAPEARARYVPLAHSLSAGYTRAVHWLRFTVAVPAAGEWWLEVQPPFLDSLRLYEPGADGFTERQAGDLLPFSRREVDYGGHVFKLIRPDASPQTYYLRVQTTSSSIAALRLWQPSDFQAAKNTEYLTQGIYFGFFTLVLLLNLIFWAWLRDALYGWFCLHVFANIVLYMNANGFTAQYLLRDSPRFADLLTSASVMLLLPAASPFFRRMLRIERDQTMSYALFRLQVILPCVLLPATFLDLFTEAARIVVVQILVAQLLALWTSYRLWRQGQHEAPYILLSIVFTILGGITSALLLLGVNPGEFLSINLRQVSGVGTILAMHFALAIRIRDMHVEQQQAHARLQVAEAAVSRERHAHEEQGRFIAMLSHELKTPLAVIDGAAQALERIDRSNDPEVARRHERIRRSVSRIDHLVEQFLTKDRIETEGMNARHGPVDVAELLRQIVDANADGGERVLLTMPVALQLAGDTALLRVAVGNLVDNALKYSPRDATVSLSAMPRVEDGRPGVEIVVADAGPGIPLEFQARMFARYARGDNVGHVSGAGLGLYLVRRIAELHGGLVELSSRAGGTVFRLWLPAMQEPSP